MIDVSILPTVNATLNAVSGTFLLVGYILIRRRQIGAHRNAMLAAFGSSTLFLISYLIYHANAGSRPFTGTGPIRSVSTGPGATALTLTPYSASSSATSRVNPCTPAFAVEYGAAPS